jgi:hypothetical protein
MATVRQFGAALERVDLGGARALHVAEPDIVDEIPPYHWRGAQAVAGWFHDFAAYAKGLKMSEPRLAFGERPRIEITGDHAYVAAPAVFSFKSAGSPVSEPGTLTLSLARAGAAWRIEAWAWNRR